MFLQILVPPQQLQQFLQQLLQLHQLQLQLLQPSHQVCLELLDVWYTLIIYVLVTGTSGTFYSVNYPGTYPNNYEEEYSISVEDGSIISLYFEYFDIEYHVSCIYDNITGKLIMIFFHQCL